MIQGELIKFGACTACAAIGILLHVWANSRPDEIRVRFWLIGGAMTAKLVLFVTILGLELPFANPVDPILHYLPETRDLLDGKLPYRDFVSVYSPFFTLLLAPAVALWDSVATVSIVMIGAEALMLAVYLGDTPRSKLRWRVATLYALSPISLYWVGIGYHSGLIATGTIIALVLLRRGRNFYGGFAAAVAFLLTKLTAIVAWPALVLFDASPRILRRASGLLTAFAVIAVLALAGLDVMMPVRLEVFRTSPGNVPSILTTLIPSLRDGAVMKVLPFVLLAAMWVPGAYVALRAAGTPSSADRRFEMAVAFIAFSYLVFMIASRKAYTFYGPTFLLFAIHASLASGRKARWDLLVFGLLGATTTIEVSVASEYLKHGREAFRYPSALLDAVVVAAYAWLAMASVKVLRSQPPSTVAVPT